MKEINYKPTEFYKYQSDKCFFYRSIRHLTKRSAIDRRVTPNNKGQTRSKAKSTLPKIRHENQVGKESSVCTRMSSSQKTQVN